MRARALLLAATLLIVACHRAPEPDALEEGAEDQNRTAAKTLADLAAADRAAAAPVRNAAPRAEPRPSGDRRVEEAPQPAIDNAAVEAAPPADQEAGASAQ